MCAGRLRCASCPFPLDPKVLPVHNAELAQGCGWTDALVSVTCLDEEIKRLAGPHASSEVAHDLRRQSAAGNVEWQGELDFVS